MPLRGSNAGERHISPSEANAGASTVEAYRSPDPTRTRDLAQHETAVRAAAALDEREAVAAFRPRWRLRRWQRIVLGVVGLCGFPVLGADLGETYWRGEGFLPDLEGMVYGVGVGLALGIATCIAVVREEPGDLARSLLERAIRAIRAAYRRSKRSDPSRRGWARRRSR